jgi:hypothetical protein
MVNVSSFTLKAREVGGSALRRRPRLGEEMLFLQRRSQRPNSGGLLQLLVLRFGLLQDRNIGVGVFPESEKIVLRSFRFGGCRWRELRGRLYTPATFAYTTAQTAT